MCSSDSTELPPVLPEPPKNRLCSVLKNKNNAVHRLLGQLLFVRYLTLRKPVVLLLIILLLLLLIPSSDPKPSSDHIIVILVKARRCVHYPEQYPGQYEFGRMPGNILGWLNANCKRCRQFCLWTYGMNSWGGKFSVQYCVILCNTVQYWAIPCNTVQYCAIQCNTVQYCEIMCNSVQHSR
jgi:hypothetical protein